MSRTLAPLAGQVCGRGLERRGVVSRTVAGLCGAPSTVQGAGPRQEGPRQGTRVPSTGLELWGLSGPVCPHLLVLQWTGPRREGSGYDRRLTRSGGPIYEHRRQGKGVRVAGSVSPIIGPPPPPTRPEAITLNARSDHGTLLLKTMQNRGRAGPRLWPNHPPWVTV